jgi:hypothetical protein
MQRRLRIGIDFDNTIAGYDAVFLNTAKRQGLIAADCLGGKQRVRDLIRAQQGELAWQRLQGAVYGHGIGQAILIDGVADFLIRCRDEAVQVFIVSHKTEYAHFERVNLRQAASVWMESHGFFAPRGLGVARENVFFESTREDKVRRICEIHCTHFIDDLAEVFEHPQFPEATARILFCQEGGARAPAKGTCCPSWSHIEATVFDGPRRRH